MVQCPDRIIASIDTGVDDALALAYLLGSTDECELGGVIAGYGNVDVYKRQGQARLNEAASHEVSNPVSIMEQLYQRVANRLSRAFIGNVGGAGRTEIKALHIVFCRLPFEAIPENDRETTN